MRTTQVLMQAWIQSNLWCNLNVMMVFELIRLAFNFQNFQKKNKLSDRRIYQTVEKRTCNKHLPILCISVHANLPASPAVVAVSARIRQTKTTICWKCRHIRKIFILKILKCDLKLVLKDSKFQRISNEYGRVDIRKRQRDTVGSINLLFIVDIVSVKCIQLLMLFWIW